MLRRHWHIIVLIVALMCAAGPVALYYYRKPRLEAELIAVIGLGSAEDALRLLRSWPAPAFDGNMARWLMAMAVWEDHVELARHVLERSGTDPNDKMWEWTEARAVMVTQPYLAVRMGGPLCYALIHGKVAIAQVLIDHGADLAVVDSDGRTLLHIAALASKSASVLLLVERGLDVNARDHALRTPLHAATDIVELEPKWQPWQPEEALEILLDAGADVHAIDHDGNTPLHLAAHRGVPELVELLLNHGADPSIRNNGGKRPIEFARSGEAELKEDRERIIEMLGRAEDAKQ